MSGQPDGDTQPAGLPGAACLPLHSAGPELGAGRGRLLRPARHLGSYHSQLSGCQAV